MCNSDSYQTPSAVLCCHLLATVVHYIYKYSDAVRWLHTSKDRCSFAAHMFVYVWKPDFICIFSGLVLFKHCKYSCIAIFWDQHRKIYYLELQFMFRAIVLIVWLFGGRVSSIISLLQYVKTINKHSTQHRFSSDRVNIFHCILLLTWVVVSK